MKTENYFQEGDSVMVSMAVDVNIPSYFQSVYLKHRGIPTKITKIFETANVCTLTVDNESFVWNLNWIEKHETLPEDLFEI